MQSMEQLEGSEGMTPRKILKMSVLRLILMNFAIKILIAIKQTNLRTTVIAIDYYM